MTILLDILDWLVFSPIPIEKCEKSFVKDEKWKSKVLECKTQGTKLKRSQCSKVGKQVNFVFWSLDPRFKAKP